MNPARKSLSNTPGGKVRSTWRGKGVVTGATFFQREFSSMARGVCSLSYREGLKKGGRGGKRTTYPVKLFGARCILAISLGVQRKKKISRKKVRIRADSKGGLGRGRGLILRHCSSSCLQGKEHSRKGEGEEGGPKKKKRKGKIP